MRPELRSTPWKGSRMSPESPPLDRVLHALRERDCGPRGSGVRWSARCPAHDDRSPSLSVSDRGGTVFVHCHAGCEQASVVGALGLTFSELRPVIPSLRDAAGPAPRPDWIDPDVLTDWHEAAHQRLLSDSSAKAARHYLRHRGVDGDLVRRYRLGFATDDAPDTRLAMLRGRLVIAEWPWHAEGRVVPHVDCVMDDVKWLSAKGASKQWWRCGDIDPSRPVLLVEGAFDVLGADRIMDGNAVAILSKTNAKPESAKRLASRGVESVYVSLDADADVSQWRRVLAVCADAGLRVRPVVGPGDSCDWGDLLALPDERYFTTASEAMSTPPRQGAAENAA